jgi:hypothetical protein
LGDQFAFTGVKIQGPSNTAPNVEGSWTSVSDGRVWNISGQGPQITCMMQDVNAMYTVTANWDQQKGVYAGSGARSDSMTGCASRADITIRWIDEAWVHISLDGQAGACGQRTAREVFACGKTPAAVVQAANLQGIWTYSKKKLVAEIVQGARVYQYLRTCLFHGRRVIRRDRGAV